MKTLFYYSRLTVSLCLAILGVSINNVTSQNKSVNTKNEFLPILLKVETNYDQFQPGDTAELVCWWQNMGNSSSARPLKGFFELSFGHQRIVETTPQFYRSYFDIYPATNQWRPGEIWKTAIRQKLNQTWGGSYSITIGLCDENHIPVPIVGEDGKSVWYVNPGQIEIGWSWGTPTIERMRKSWSKEFNSVSNAKRWSYANKLETLTIGSDPIIRLSATQPVVTGIGELNNSIYSGDNSPIVSIREFEKDRLFYSTEPEFKIDYKAIAKGNSAVTYQATVSQKKFILARFHLNFETVGRQLQVRLTNVVESEGYELIDIKLPSVLSLSGDDVFMVNFFGGGRLVSLKDALPQGYILNYDTRNAAALLTRSDQVVMESTCLDDKLIQSVHENLQVRTASMGMVLANRVAGKGKIASIPVENDHCITIDLLDKSWGKPDWQNAAKYLRKDLKGKNRDLYRNSLFYKTLATSGPQPTEGRVREDSPYGIKRLTTVIQFKKIKEFTRQYYNIFDGLKQFSYIAGFEEGGFDNGYPYVFNTDQRAGTVEELKECINEGEKYNAIVTMHDNYDTNVPGGNHYDPRITALDNNGNPWLGWIWPAGIEHIVAPFKYAQLGLMQERVRKTVQLYGIHTSYYLDVLTSEPLRYDFDPKYPASADKSFKGKLAIIDEFNKYGIDITSESLLHPFVGHIGHAFWPREDRKTILFKGDKYIPLVPFVYHGTIAYCAQATSDDNILWAMIIASRVFPSEEGLTNDDIKAIYIQHLPIDQFYDKKMDRIEKTGDLTKVVYDAQSYVMVNTKELKYEIVNDGIVIGKDWTTFVKGTKPNTYLAYSVKGGEMIYNAPADWDEKSNLKAFSLSLEGLGQEVPYKIENGIIRLNMPAETPVKISIQ